MYFVYNWQGGLILGCAWETLYYYMCIFTYYVVSLNAADGQMPVTRGQ